jgi:inorganic pyrophosphatase
MIKIDSPKYSIIKYKDDGSFHYFFPFIVNYGSVIGTKGDDKDKVDAIVLGKRLPKGWIGEVKQKGVVRFIDNGVRDDKFIFKNKRLNIIDKIIIRLIFLWIVVYKKNSRIIEIIL